MLPRLRKGDMVAHEFRHKLASMPGTRFAYYVGRKNGKIVTSGISVGGYEEVEPGRVVKVRRGDRVIYEAHSEGKESA